MAASSEHTSASSPSPSSSFPAPADGVVRIDVWSGPRSLSTALMYSFAQRSDTTVLDEPLYAHHLRLNPHLQRPYKEELFKSQNADGNAVVRELILGPCKTRVLYAKNMGKQLQGLDDSFLRHTRNVILIRNPVDMIASWEAKLPPTLEESSFPHLLSLWSRLHELGQEPVVVDAELLQRDPEGVLTELCKRLGLDFQPAMLKWEAGPKPYDGIWASFWYGGIHKSTCFHPPSGGRALAPSLAPLLEACYPVYHVLRRRAIGASIPISQMKPGAIASRGDVWPELPDARNAAILAWVGASLVPRSFASMSVFDSSVQGGDAVWEGLRVYDGKVLHLEEHLSRLHDSARAMAFADIPSKEFVKEAIYRTLVANGMRDGVHMRLTLSRGEKVTSSMNPKFNAYGSRLIVLAEWKPVEGAATYDNTAGVKLITACNRRNPPSCVDSKIHHNNLINNILPKIQANNAGAADAVMLDLEGFVSETNATNLFCVRRGQLITPHADYCLPGITRGCVLDLARELGIPAVERRLSLMELQTADEAFTTGTMGGLTPVVEVDGRVLGAGVCGPVTARLQEAYGKLAQHGTPIEELYKAASRE